MLATCYMKMSVATVIIEGVADKLAKYFSGHSAALWHTFGCNFITVVNTPESHWYNSSRFSPNFTPIMRRDTQRQLSNLVLGRHCSHAVSLSNKLRISDIHGAKFE